MTQGTAIFISHCNDVTIRYICFVATSGQARQISYFYIPEVTIPQWNWYAITSPISDSSLKHHLAISILSSSFLACINKIQNTYSLSHETVGLGQISIEGLFTFHSEWKKKKAWETSSSAGVFLIVEEKK